jgi:magnesium transporter
MENGKKTIFHSILHYPFSILHSPFSIIHSLGSVMPHPLFSPEVTQLLQTDDKGALETFCETLHPATVAESLTDSFSVEDTWRVLRSTNVATQASIFEYFPLEWQMKMVHGGGRQEMAHLIEKMSADDRADLMRKLPGEVSEGLLRLVDEADRRDIATLSKYPENTAGSLMTTDYAWLPENITVAEALDRLRLQAPDKETIYYVYVVDEGRRLKGVVSLRDLILADRRIRITELMNHSPILVRDTDDREKVAREFSEYDLLAMPVVDADDRLVGIITSDDVLDVVVSEATEDVHRMGGVGPLEESYLESSFLRLWRSRAFWLSCLFLAELFTFTALSYFEDAIAQVVVLSLFVPLCISTGGNSGSQAATLITRALALGQIGVRDWFRVLRHEIVMGLVLGLTLGLIGFGRASLTPEGIRSNSPPRNEPFTVSVSKDSPLEVRRTSTWAWWWPFGGEEVHVILPPDTKEVILGRSEPTTIELPEGANEPKPTIEDGRRVYKFPPKCTIRQPPVPRYRLAVVIAMSVAAICLWGTLMGSMLPIVFRRMGVDPGIASSPFVATFVDVTGIVIYFSIAKTVLWDFLK